MPITQLDKDNFFDFIDNNSITVVDFWAKWCAPCLAFAKTFEKVSENYKEIGFGKIDIENHSELSDLFQISSIPHLMIFKDGIAIFSESGSMPKSTLTSLIEQAITVDITEVKKEIKDKEV